MSPAAFYLSQEVFHAKNQNKGHCWEFVPCGTTKLGGWKMFNAVSPYKILDARDQHTNFRWQRPMAFLSRRTTLQTLQTWAKYLRDLKPLIQGIHVIYIPHYLLLSVCQTNLTCTKGVHRIFRHIPMVIRTNSNNTSLQNGSGSLLGLYNVEIRSFTVVVQIQYLDTTEKTKVSFDNIKRWY